MTVSAADGPIVNACRLGAGTDVINSRSFTHFDRDLASLGQLMAAFFRVLLVVDSTFVDTASKSIHGY